MVHPESRRCRPPVVLVVEETPGSILICAMGAAISLERGLGGDFARVVGFVVIVWRRVVVMI